MYGLPHDVDLSFFLQKTLVQICFGGADLGLNFHGGVSVMVTGRIGFVFPGGKQETFEDYRLAAPFLLQLLNENVSMVKGDRNGTLRLGFLEKGTLEIYDDSQQFESYVIRKLGEKEIVV
jgi:hypothetical protein